MREVLEPLGVVNEVQEDYGIDFSVQVFDGGSPTGASFHVQLKSSASSDYATDQMFIAQKFSIDHIRHYALDMREPLLVIHVDVISKRVYWYAPQLDSQLVATLRATDAKSITVRIPTSQKLPETAPDLHRSLSSIYLTLASRRIVSASPQSFAEMLDHTPDQEQLYQAFQEKSDTLKLQRIRDLYKGGLLDQARPRANTIVADPDSTIEIKFWALILLYSIDYKEARHSGRPQSELPEITLKHAKALQELTASGPNYLKFHSLIVRHAAELDILSHEAFGLFLAVHQHLQHGGEFAIAFPLYARLLAHTRRIISKYNQCVRLARYAARYPDRWMLGRALTAIVRSIAPYLITLDSEGEFESKHALAMSSLQICKVAAWISSEAQDSNGVVLSITSALLITRSEDSDAYRWAIQVARRLNNGQARTDALLLIENAVKRWRGEPVEGDYRGDNVWQIIQNIAASLSIDLSDDSDPLVQSLRIAAKDNSPERVLTKCEHLLVSQGAIGPNARLVQRLFNIGTASSKVLHCTLHDYHLEGKELDPAYEEFKRAHCDACPDSKARASGWRYSADIRRDLESRHRDFVKRLAGTPQGIRYTSED
jgi:hypothetical protein